MTTELKVHEQENNHESRVHLEENRDRFTNQCQIVLDLLNSGVRLTVKDAIVKHNIMSLPRRIMDLKRLNNVKGIKDKWVVSQEGFKLYKVWYMDGTEEPAQEEKKKADPKPKKEKTVMPPNQNPLFELM